MTLNDKYCKLLDFDFGYDNQALSDKIERISDEFAVDFAEWCDDLIIGEWSDKTTKELLEIYKKENKL